MITTVKLSLNSLKWNFLSNALRQIAPLAPIDGREVESLVLAELYQKKIGFFTFFKPVGKLKLATITLTMAQAYALNKLLGRTDGYNVFLRMHIEPFLLAGNIVKIK